MLFDTKAIFPTTLSVPFLSRLCHLNLLELPVFPTYDHGLLTNIRKITQPGSIRSHVCQINICTLLN